MILTKAPARQRFRAGSSTKQRGRLVRDIADRRHSDPFGVQVQVARATLDRWIRRYRTGGFEA